MAARTWVKATASFHTDLARGRLGELAFLHACSGTITPTDGKEGDFLVKDSGHKIELKTDYYNHDKTENFFIERYRSGFKPGGPFQAEEHGAKYFIYSFSNQGIFYIFDTKQLVAFLEHLAASKQISLIDIPNRGYTTRGWKIPRVLFEELMLDWSDIGVDFSSKKYANFRDYNKATA